MELCKFCEKGIILGLYLVFLIIGTTLTLHGALFLNDMNELKKMIDFSNDYFLVTPFILLVQGLIIVVLSGLGSLGTLKKNMFLLEAIATMIAFSFLAQIFLNILTFLVISDRDNIADSASSSVGNIFNYSSNMEVINVIQSKLECCGNECQRAISQFVLNILVLNGAALVALLPLQLMGVYSLYGLSEWYQRRKKISVLYTL